MKKLPLLSLVIQNVLALHFSRDERSIMVVEGRKGVLPLCSNSYKQLYGEQICGSEGSAFSSFENVTLSSSTYSLSCINETDCFTFQSPYCTTGIRVNCDLKFCLSGDLYMGGKCIQIGNRLYSSYSEAKFIIVFTYSDVAYFTSGCRRGSDWYWEDGTKIEREINGDGRCLAILNGEWKGIDCDHNGYILCEYGRECIDQGRYTGRLNSTREGQPCMKWNDPSILFYGSVIDEQNTMDHNLCRSVADDSPSCFVAPQQLKSCGVPVCGSISKELRAEPDKDKCGVNEFSCADGTCVAAEFRCDYENDCSDGSDEQECDDYLASYELMGPMILIDKISEVWANIPHVQGCAQRCSESTLLCEAFSFELRSQRCMLTDSSNTTNNIIPKSSSQFYKRRFSTRDVEMRLDGTILQAALNGTWKPVCNEGFDEEYATSICQVFGFGISVAAVEPLQSVGQGPLPFGELTTLTSTTMLPDSEGWTLECLRGIACLVSQKCAPLRCSQCLEAVCGDGTCIQRSQLCNKVPDCTDASDEKGCSDFSMRLANGAETSGAVEVFFHGRWEPICGEKFRQEEGQTACKKMMLGVPATVLPATLSFSYGWSVECDTNSCSLQSRHRCTKQANIKCSPTRTDSSGTCGIRRVEYSARDPIRARLARVVGGFTTVKGAFPWTASIRYKLTGEHHCGASIIDRTHLLTAAHCFEEDRRPQTYIVTVGEWDNSRVEGSEQTFNITRLHFYPLYQDLFSHDLAIVEIGRPGMEWSDWVQPICLPPRNFDYQTGRKCVVSGWGSIGLQYPSKMQAALLPIIDRSECINSSRIYSSMGRSAFCAGYLEGGVDSCQGDSGGPLGCQNAEGVYLIAGVISWGDGCAQKKQPGIYTMVAPYLSWIDSILAERPPIMNMPT